MVVGLTGGIGSGKSTVAKVFELLGCKVFNSDAVAKQCYFDEAIKLQVIALLGNEAYLNTTTLNKSYISSKIFSNKNLLDQLNAIIHPAVKDKFELFKKNNANQLIIKETALLFETGLFKDVDKIILVVADDAIRIKRTMLRDTLSEEEVIKKINSQHLQEDKIKQSHFIIYNNETEFIITQVLDVYKQLC